MRKRLLSLLLTVFMTLSLLPAPAYASVGDLLGNSPGENQALLEELEQLTGRTVKWSVPFWNSTAFWIKTAILSLTGLSNWTGQSIPWMRSRPCSATRTPT